jgi:hypothetical protein
MHTLQAAEEQSAARSKASGKRVRKQAAARAAAAAAAAAPMLTSLPPQHGQGSSVSAAGNMAAQLQSMSLADAAAVQAGPTAGCKAEEGSTSAAADGRQQRPQQSPAWALCPITKVGA